MKEFWQTMTTTWWGILLICIVCVAVWIMLSALLYKPFFKRFYDIVLSFIAIIVFSPLLLVLMIVGAIAMKGNPFFVQKRPGRRKKLSNKQCAKRGVPYGTYDEEKIIKLIKLRTMTNERDENGELLPDEQRLTRYGKFLRSTSLDELFSLVNIIKGDLSIVGPRPLLVRYLPYYKDNERHRHDVRQGLTGLAQVNGRNFLSWEEVFEYDLYYVENYSLFVDISIIFSTVIKVLKRQDITDVTQNGGSDGGRKVFAAFDKERSKAHIKEIGSNFYSYDCLIDNNKKLFFNNGITTRNIYLYKSGRNAIKALCKHLSQSEKSVLLPNYICDSVVQPFVEEGWRIHYYDIKIDFKIDEVSLLNKINLFHPNAIVVQSYFGFNTLDSFYNKIENIRKQGIIVIEDVTHSLFSNYKRCNADYFIGSLRKFFAIPDGGIIFSNYTLDELSPIKRNGQIAQLAKKAFDMKKRYMSNEQCDKEQFRQTYAELQLKIAENDNIVGISQESIDILNGINFIELSIRRRKNYKYLLDFLNNLELDIPLDELDESIVPLYFPILLNDSRIRDTLQSYLISNNIYCPIIWPRLSVCDGTDLNQNDIYNHILCIPIDQRYSEDDMQIIVNYIKAFFAIRRLKHKS